MQQQRLEFTRYGGLTENEYGQLVTSSPTTYTALGALQPLGIGIQTNILPEGYRESDARIFYTKTKVFADSVLKNTVADETVIDGETYKVIDCGDWSTNLSRLAHYKVVIVKKEVSV